MSHKLQDVVTLAVTLLSLLFAGASFAQTVNEQQKLTASDREFLDYFGQSVAMDGDTAVIGARLNDDNGNQTGSAYVFTGSPGVWTEQQKLTASDSVPGSHFGFSLAIDGDAVVIGAAGTDYTGLRPGAAYVFTRSLFGGLFTEQQKLTASDGYSNDKFGASVDVHGDTTVIGASGLTLPSHAGAAYVFTRSTLGGPWTEQQKLTARGGVAGYRFFGFSVAIFGDTAVIGNYLDPNNGINSGAAYVFTRNAGVWTEQQKLTPSDGVGSDFFGHSVAMDGDTAVIGAPGDDYGNPSDFPYGNESGAAYVFTRSAGVWTEQQKLTASDGGPIGQFGFSVAVDGDTAVIGARRDNDNGLDSGAAYVFTRFAGEWFEREKLAASDSVARDWFGHSVAVDGDTAVIGAWGEGDDDIDPTLPSAAGAAYVFASLGTLTLIPRRLCIQTCGPFGQWGCNPIVFGCYILPAIIIIIPIILIWWYWIYRRRQKS